MLELYQTLGLCIAVLCVVIIFQSILLGRILRSWAWRFLLAGFLIIGGLQAYRFVTLPVTMLRAIQMKEELAKVNPRLAETILPETLTLTQQLIIVITFAFFILVILGLDRLRRDLKKIGVGI